MYMKVLEEWMAHSRYSININIFLLSLLRSPRRKKKIKKTTCYLNIGSVMLVMVLITNNFIFPGASQQDFEFSD